MCRANRKISDKSAIRAILVEDSAEKRFTLDRIMDHYRAQGPYAYPDDILAKTTIIRIEIENLTGKRRE